MGKKRGAYKEDRKQVFIDAFKKLGTKIHAAQAAGVDPKTVNKWLDQDPEFAADFLEADTHVTEMLERAALQRAVVGVLRPVYQNGVKVGEVREYSDTLTIFLLKARKPMVYRDHVKMELTGEDGKPIETKRTIDMTNVDETILKKLADGVSSQK